ncbi:hypothetical protein NRIC_36160 [Enterococcus florum]|uniref:Uncharacterized protein n=1 Tax=Enterococcus florum TaxID=2480627 RepID=A0A4P5PBY4_9ENTE|nr:hypothetical protein [Enterococcus florum]GCF95725.1 hypothetical protein NRIC_36160 [Enterococcus florum]
MNYYESIGDLLLDLHADLQDIGDEIIWVYYDQEEKVIDYRYKASPDEKRPVPLQQQTIREMNASELFKSLQ